MTIEQVKEVLSDMTREQLIELAAALTISEQELRQELDTVQGIIR